MKYYKFSNKISSKYSGGAILGLFATALTAVSATAQTYHCVLPAQGPSVEKKVPHGNWGPQHNTNNWHYAAVNGPDIYRHKNGKRTVGTRCKGLGYDYGTLKVDMDGNQDYCVRTHQGWPERTGTPSCSSGYTLSADHGTCSRPARPGYWKKNRKPKGNWGPQHNTNNWHYAAVNGPDIYRHKNGKRTVGTRCKGLGYDYGTLKVDLDGNQDYCATWIPASPASTVSADCSPLGGGFHLQPKGGGNSGSSGANGSSSGGSGANSDSGASFSLGSDKPSTVKLPGCCPPWNDKILQNSFEYKGTGNIASPYSLRFNMSQTTKNQLQAYLDYLHALDPSVQKIIINFRLFDKGQNPSSPGLGTQIGTAHFVEFTAGHNGAITNGGGNFFNIPVEQMQTNRWYLVQTGIYLNDGKTAFGKDCANSFMYIKIEVQGKSAGDGPPRVVLVIMPKNMRPVTIPLGNSSSHTKKPKPSKIKKGALIKRR